MALEQNTKLAHSQLFGDRSVYIEVIDRPSVDDVLNFMSHSEAGRRLSAIYNYSRDTQLPSDELKEYLLQSLE